MDLRRSYLTFYVFHFHSCWVFFFFCVHSHLWFMCVWVMLRADKSPCSNENLWQMAAGLTAQTLWGLNLFECLLGGLEGKNPPVLWNIAQDVFRSINFTRFKVSGRHFLCAETQFLFPSRMLILINGWNFCHDIYSLLHRGPNIDMLHLTWEAVSYMVASGVSMMTETIVFVSHWMSSSLFLDSDSFIAAAQSRQAIVFVSFVTFWTFVGCFPPTRGLPLCQ